MSTPHQNWGGEGRKEVTDDADLGWLVDVAETSEALQFLR